MPMEIGRCETRDCAWFKNEKKLHIYSEAFAGGFPHKIMVTSSHTGKVMEFRHITEEHPKFCHDHWDGEMAVYEPVKVEDRKRVALFVITHAY